MNLTRVKGSKILGIEKLKNKYKELPAQVKVSLWVMICSFASKGIAVITTPIFTRLMSTAEYGQYSVFLSWQGILSIFVALNLSAGVFISGLVRFSEGRAEFVSAMQGLSLTLISIWTVIYLVGQEFWNSLFSLDTVQIFAMLVMMWCTAVFSFWVQTQRVDYKYTKMVVVTMFVTVVNPALGVFAVMHSDNPVTARILATMAVELLAYSWIFFVHMKQGKVFFSKAVWKYALVFNIPLVPHYLAMNILSSADRIMIGNYIGTSEAGIYSLAYSLSQVMTVFNGALMSSIEPWMYKKIKDGTIQGMSRVAYPTFIMVAGMNLLLIAFAPEAIALFAPKEYYDAIWIVPSVAMSVYFSFAYTYFAVFEFYYKKTIIIAIATVVGAVLNILLNHVFLQIFGYYAAGYTTLACYMIFAVAHYVAMTYVCNKYLDGAKPYDLRILLGISAVFMVLGFAFLFSYFSIFARYGLIAVLVMILLVKRGKVKGAFMNIINIRKGRNI